MSTIFKRISEETLKIIKELDLKEFAEARGEHLRQQGRIYYAYVNGGERTPSLAITPYKRIWRDFSRGVGGNDVVSFQAYRMFDTVELRGEQFIRVIEEVAKIAGITIVYEDGSVLENGPRKVQDSKPIGEDIDVKTKDITRLHQVNTTLIECMNLSDEHRTKLYNERRLDNEQIDVRQYRSLMYNPRTRLSIAQAVVKKVGEPEGIPGFIQELVDGKKRWNMIGKKGIFIPFRSIHNVIQGFQVRLDDPRIVVVSGKVTTKQFEDGRIQVLHKETREVLWSGHKDELPFDSVEGRVVLDKGQPYLWFSSSSNPERGIVKAARILPAPYHCAVPTHILKNWEVGTHISSVMDTEEVWIGEGPLKGDIASDYTHRVHLQIASVSAIISLFDVVLELGAKTVVLAPDADAQTKPDSVGVAVHSLVKEAIDFFVPKGITVKFAVWDISCGKGIDDTLNGGFAPNFLVWNDRFKKFSLVNN